MSTYAWPGLPATLPGPANTPAATSGGDAAPSYTYLNTNDTNIVLTQANVILKLWNSDEQTVTLPRALSNAGQRVLALRAGSSSHFIQTSGGDDIEAAIGASSAGYSLDGYWVELVSTGAGTWMALT